MGAIVGKVQIVQASMFVRKVLVWIDASTVLVQVSLAVLITFV